MKQTLHSLHGSKDNNKLFSHITSKIICPFYGPKKKHAFNTRQKYIFKHVLDMLPLIKKDTGRPLRRSYFYKK